MGVLQDIGGGVCRIVYGGPNCYDTGASTAMGVAILATLAALMAFSRFAAR
jgi:hypothetical protein